METGVPPQWMRRLRSAGRSCGSFRAVSRRHRKLSFRSQPSLRLEIPIWTTWIISFLTPSGPISSCKASSSPDICPSAFCRALRRVPFVSSRRASAPAPSAPHPPWAGGDQPELHVRGLPAPRQSSKRTAVTKIRADATAANRMPRSPVQTSSRLSRLPLSGWPTNLLGRLALLPRRSIRLNRPPQRIHQVHDG